MQEPVVCRPLHSEKKIEKGKKFQGLGRLWMCFERLKIIYHGKSLSGERVFSLEVIRIREYVCSICI